MKNSYFKDNRFQNAPIEYDNGWIVQTGEKIKVLKDNSCLENATDNTWSVEIEEMHREPLKEGWIEVYERNLVLKTLSEIILKNKNAVVVEFGSSEGYMCAEIKEQNSDIELFATDMMYDGLYRSFSVHPEIRHIQCDFADAPFKDSKIDVVYSLNVLEHIEDDIQCIKESYRILKSGDAAFL